VGCTGAGPVKGSTDGGSCARTWCFGGLAASARCDAAVWAAARNAGVGVGVGVGAAATCGRGCDATRLVVSGPRTAAATMPAERTT